MKREQGPDTPIEVIRPQRLVPYDEAYRAQVKRRIAIEQGRAGHALFLLEHPAVITLGKSSQRENLLRSQEELDAMGVALHETDRGGDVTYHGPGQLVAYPLLDLRSWRKSIRWYLRSLEGVLIRTLERYGLQGERVEGFTGVWVNGAKVAAIGVGIHNWVTFHGIALNVCPDMSHFNFIIPCGIQGKPVTSLERLLGVAPSMPDVMDAFEQSFLEWFQ